MRLTRREEVPGIGELIARLEARTGHRIRPNPIPPEVTFREWCEQLGREGLKVDGFPFTLENRPAMHFVYDLIPASIEDARGRTVVLMKCAQVGFTVMEMLACIYMALKFEPCKIGMFLPDMALARGKSAVRFMPIVRTVPDAYERMVMDDERGGGRKSGEGNVMIREIGDSRFHFLWTSGKATTESYPMDVISFDEVQEMAVADMEKVKERLSASRVKFTLMGSTAKDPDADIHWWYQRGTMHQFHTECPHCHEKQVLDEHFPDCIEYDEAAGDYYYRCHACGGRVADPQRGEWIAKDPGARIVSAHFPQFLSPTISPREIIESFFNADDLKNFYNRKLGKPYTDPSQVPVSLDILNDCARLGVAAGVVWKDSARGTFMGVDQMGNFNVAIIKERLPDGRQATIHIEAIYSSPNPDNPEASPFDRCDELMHQYGVQVCVIETLPNYNDAKRFAARHPGRVFLASYKTIEEGMLHWGDAPLDRSERKTSEEARDRYTVALDQYKCMQVSMRRFAGRACLFPDPAGLVQEIEEKGVKKTIAILKDMMFVHLTHTALVAIQDKEQKKFRRAVKKVGIDPHFSYANMLCDVAWARAYGTATFIIPEAPVVESQEKIKESMPGLPDTVVRMVEDVQWADTCGACSAFEEERCTERDMLTRANDPACPWFAARNLE